MSIAPKRVGVLGTGQMGRPIVRTLLRAGQAVVIAPRRPGSSTDLVEAGATRVDRPADLRPLVDTVVTSLPDITSVRAALLGPGGLLDGGTWEGLVIETSTVAPEDARALSTELHERGVRSLDAPVSGGPGGAEAGSLAVMVGGSPETFEEAKPLLDIIGGRVVRCGPSGAGQIAKACNQLIVMSTIVAVSEMLTLAEHAGTDPASVREVLLGGLASSPILEVHGKRMLDGVFDPGGRARLHEKDIKAIAAIAADAGLELPLFEAARSRFERLFATPDAADLDHSAVYTTYPHATTAASMDEEPELRT